MFFNIGGGELLVIAMVALIAVGPEQLPSVLRKIGKGVAQIRAMTAGLRDEFMSGIDEVTDAVDPQKWTGSGSDDDPVVPRGYAKQQKTERAEAEVGSVDGDSANGSGDDVVVNKIAQANARSAITPRSASRAKRGSVEPDADPERAAGDPAEPAATGASGRNDPAELADPAEPAVAGASGRTDPVDREPNTEDAEDTEDRA
ncbi:MAG: twin-arginine translocase TatA/TatE family subunit [Acidimicrobiia bacterium]|nr:twin-arginine translocase TatA/TatE family subunit [Acidimicrobiia bacterium]